MVKQPNQGKKKTKIARSPEKNIPKKEKVLHTPKTKTTKDITQPTKTNTINKHGASEKNKKTPHTKKKKKKN